MVGAGTLAGMGGVMATMAPRLAVIIRDADGTAKLPQTVTINGVVREVWSRVAVCDVGGLPGREYRSADGQTLFVIVRLAQRTLGDGRVALLVVVWTPADSRFTWRPVYADILGAIGVDLVAWWPCELSSPVTCSVTYPAASSIDGVQRSGSTTTTYVTSAALTADNSTTGTAAKASWPAAWKAYANGDTFGTPTGALIVAAHLA